MQQGLPPAAVLILLSFVALSAQDLAQADPPASAVAGDQSTNHDSGGDSLGWLRAWTRVTDEARASQPHFVAPLLTTHVMLVQQFRYDMSWQRDPSVGATTSNYGNSRGLEIIPSSRLEVGIFPPSYIAHQMNAAKGSATCRIR
jgi:hypothetical protein